MAPKRVLIVNVRSLLLETVAGLLDSNGNGNFDVVSTLVDNLPELIHEIGQIKPDIIVLDEATAFTKPADLIVALLNIQAIRLIVVNSETNKMGLYDKSEFMISHPSHFIDALNYKWADSSLQRR